MHGSLRVKNSVQKNQIKTLSTTHPNMKKLKNSENLGNCFVLLQSNNLLENTLEGECDRDTHKFLEKNVEENLIKRRLFIQYLKDIAVLDKKQQVVRILSTCNFFSQ